MLPSEFIKATIHEGKFNDKFNEDIDKLFISRKEVEAIIDLRLKDLSIKLNRKETPINVQMNLSGAILELRELKSKIKEPFCEKA